LQSYGGDILVTGHTHKVHNELINGVLLLNPESAGGKNASIAILIIDEKDKLITDIDINFINL
jgi:predicted phosphodiesterase